MLHRNYIQKWLIKFPQNKLLLVPKQHKQWDTSWNCFAPWKIWFKSISGLKIIQEGMHYPQSVKFVTPQIFAHNFFELFLLNYYFSLKLEHFTYYNLLLFVFQLWKCYIYIIYLVRDYVFIVFKFAPLNYVYGIFFNF